MTTPRRIEEVAREIHDDRCACLDDRTHELETVRVRGFLERLIREAAEVAAKEHDCEGFTAGCYVANAILSHFDLDGGDGR